MKYLNAFVWVHEILNKEFRNGLYDLSIAINFYCSIIDIASTAFGSRYLVTK